VTFSRRFDDSECGQTSREPSTAGRSKRDVSAEPSLPSWNRHVLPELKISQRCGIDARGVHGGATAERRGDLRGGIDASSRTTQGAGSTARAVSACPVRVDGSFEAVGGARLRIDRRKSVAPGRPRYEVRLHSCWSGMGSLPFAMVRSDLPRRRVVPIDIQMTFPAATRCRCSQCTAARLPPDLQVAGSSSSFGNKVPSGNETKIAL